MKLGICFLLLALITISCGKNAFTEKTDNQIRRALPSTPGDEIPDECEFPRHDILDPKTLSDTTVGSLPFDFSAIGQGDHTHHLDDEDYTEYVDLAHVVLPFDLSSVNGTEVGIDKMYLTFDTFQVYKTSWMMHNSQLCQNFGKKCSGNYENVLDHIADDDYSWITDYDFTNYVASNESTRIDDDLASRQFSANVNLLPFFHEYPELTDLPTDYQLYLADNHLITNAKLHIVYCNNP